MVVKLTIQKLQKMISEKLFVYTNEIAMSCNFVLFLLVSVYYASFACEAILLYCLLCLICL